MQCSMPSAPLLSPLYSHSVSVRCDKISRLTIIDERSRLIGDEAVPHTSSENTIVRLNELLGCSLDDITSKDFMQHSKMQLHARVNGVVYASVSHCGVEEEFAVPSLFAVLLHRIIQRVDSGYSKDTGIALCLPTNPSVQRAIEDACGVAGIPIDRVSLHHPDDCLLAAYQRKLAALRNSELAPLDVSMSMLIAVLISLGPICGTSRDGSPPELGDSGASDPAGWHSSCHKSLLSTQR